MTIFGASLGRSIEAIRTSAVLTSSFVSPDPWTLPAGTAVLSVVCTYTAHGSASTPAMGIRPAWVFADDSEIPDQLLVDEVDTPSGYANSTLYPRQYTCSSSCVIELRAPPGAVSLKVYVAETGDTEHLGTASIGAARAVGQ